MNPTTPQGLDTTDWASAFPWLELSPEERETLSRLCDPELDRFAISVARRAIDRQVTTPLDLLFPTLPPTFELDSLAWPARHRNVLRRHRLLTAADLSTITIAHLLGTWSVSTLTTEAILTRLVHTTMGHSPRPGPRGLEAAKKLALLDSSALAPAEARRSVTSRTDGT